MPCPPDSSHRFDVRLGDGLFTALQERCRRTGESTSHVICEALAEALDQEHHTIYQVSTSGALVQGVYQGCVQVSDLLKHGDFGLGTFDGLDGEGILLDGICWQACGDGTVTALAILKVEAGEKGCSARLWLWPRSSPRRLSSSTKVPSTPGFSGSGSGSGSRNGQGQQCHRQQGEWRAHGFQGVRDADQPRPYVLGAPAGAGRGISFFPSPSLACCGVLTGAAGSEEPALRALVVAVSGEPPPPSSQP